MKVVVKLYATLQGYLSAAAKTTNSLKLELDAGTTIQQLIERFALPQKLRHLVLIDGSFVAPAERGSRILEQDNTLAIRPPVAGG